MCMAELLGRAAKIYMALSFKKSAQVTGLLKSFSLISQKSLFAIISLSKLGVWIRLQTMGKFHETLNTRN